MLNKKYLAETIGTFALVFCGTGAIIIDEQTHGAVSHVGVAATFGLIVLAMIYCFGEISGAHFNPAVSIGFAIAGKFDNKQIAPYVLCQVIGAFAATLVLKILFPEDQNLGTTSPAGSSMQSFVLELILTFFLMLVILNVSQGSKEAGILAGIAIGAMIGLEAMFAGPICGASMNPARSLAPAVVSGNIQSIWLYLLAPAIGAIAAAFTWRSMNKKSSADN